MKRQFERPPTVIFFDELAHALQEPRKVLAHSPTAALHCVQLLLLVQKHLKVLSGRERVRLHSPLQGVHQFVNALFELGVLHKVLESRLLQRFFHDLFLRYARGRLHKQFVLLLLLLRPHRLTDFGLVPWVLIPGFHLKFFDAFEPLTRD